jgi:hypothetical protein
MGFPSAHSVNWPQANVCGHFLELLLVGAFMWHKAIGFVYKQVAVAYPTDGDRV